MLLCIKLYDQHRELAYSHSTALIYNKYMDFIGLNWSYIYRVDNMFLPFFVSSYCYENL